jgi:hypothetical protein
MRALMANTPETPVVHLMAERILGSRTDVECAVRSGPRCDPLLASSAIPALHRPLVQFLRGAHPTPATESASDQVKNGPCPIMGNILLELQQVEIYSAATLYPNASVGCIAMAKPQSNQQHKAIQALRKTIEDLMEEKGLSYRTLAARAHAPPTVGRTINSLVKGANSTRVDLVTAAADGLGVEMWQLFVPDIAKLDGVERKQLKELVQTFVKGGPAAREALMSVLKIRSELIKAQSVGEEAAE